MSTLCLLRIKLFRGLGSVEPKAESRMEGNESPLVRSPGNRAPDSRLSAVTAPFRLPGTLFPDSAMLPAPAVAVAAVVAVKGLFASPAPAVVDVAVKTVATGRAGTVVEPPLSPVITVTVASTKLCRCRCSSKICVQTRCRVTSDRPTNQTNIVHASSRGHDAGS